MSTHSLPEDPPYPSSNTCFIKPQWLNCSPIQLQLKQWTEILDHLLAIKKQCQTMTLMVLEDMIRECLHLSEIRYMQQSVDMRQRCRKCWKPVLSNNEIR
jgi:hypothetical protein